MTLFRKGTKVFSSATLFVHLNILYWKPTHNENINNLLRIGSLFYFQGIRYKKMRPGFWEKWEFFQSNFGWWRSARGNFKLCWFVVSLQRQIWNQIKSSFIQPKIKASTGDWQYYSCFNKCMHITGRQIWFWIW